MHAGQDRSGRVSEGSDEDEMSVAIIVTQQNRHTTQYKHKLTHSLLLCYMQAVLQEQELHVITNAIELPRGVYAQEVHKNIFSGERKLKVT